MVRERCPGCGAPYNGRRCRMCLYAPMETELSRRAKKAPEQKTMPHRQKKRKSAASSLMGILFIIILIAITLPVMQNWGVRLKAIEAANRTPEPIPGNPVVLFQQDPITVLVPDPDSPSISLWFYNHSKEDAVVICRDITVNDYRMNDTLLSVFVPAGSAVKGTLLELETFADAFTFTMEAQKPNGEFLFETGPIRLKERTSTYD